MTPEGINRLQIQKHFVIYCNLIQERSVPSCFILQHSNTGFSCQAKPRNSQTLSQKHFFYLPGLLTFTSLQAISPGNIVCHVGGAVETLCKLRELTCPPHCCLSLLVYDHLAGIAAAQVCTGLPAAVSVTQSHQSTSLPLSFLTVLSASHKQSASCTQICQFSLSMPQ